MSNGATKSTERFAKSGTAIVTLSAGDRSWLRGESKVTKGELMVEIAAGASRDRVDDIRQGPTPASTKPTRTYRIDTRPRAAQVTGTRALDLRPPSMVRRLPETPG